MTDEKVLLTPEQAEALLEDGEYVHNYTSGPMLLGCDYDRADAIDAFRRAKSIEIAGPGAKAMRHPLAVTEQSGRVTFFAADMEKVAAFEAASLVDDTLAQQRLETQP